MAEPPRLASRQWRALALRTEDVIVGSSDGVPAPLVRPVANALEGGEALYYGWPLVIVADRWRTRRVAPLLMTVLDPPGPDDDEAVASIESVMNPGLLNDSYFPADALAAVDERTAGGLPFGDVDAMTAAAADLSALLGLDGADRLAPDVLEVRLPAHRPGVYNVAVVRGPSSLMTRSLVDELQELCSVPDWRETAAGLLLGDAPAPVAPAPPALGPLRLNDAQEQAVAPTLTQRLTVVTGPPGTGKSQLVAAVVANAWACGESVLVASTNNGAVDVATCRANQIDPALLVRTGNATVREALPDVFRNLAARASAQEAFPELVTRRWEVAVERRSAVHQRLERRAAAEVRLARLAAELEAHRSILWGGREPPALDGAARRALERRARRARAARVFKHRRRAGVLRAAGAGPGHVGVDDVLAWAEAANEWDRMVAEVAAHGPRDADADAKELADADAAWREASAAVVSSSVSTRLAAPGSSPRLNHLAEVRPQARHERRRATEGAMETARGWACTALSVAGSFPLKAGLFDLVVIDEASQCGIAEMLPLAYRAKRIVIVGDPAS